MDEFFTRYRLDVSKCIRCYDPLRVLECLAVVVNVHFYYLLVHFIHAVVVLILTRIIKSVVTGQAPVTLELRNTPGKKHKPKVVHA